MDLTDPKDVDPIVNTFGNKPAWEDKLIIAKWGERYGTYVPAGYNPVMYVNTTTGQVQGSLEYTFFPSGSDVSFEPIAQSVKVEGSAAQFGASTGGFYFLEGFRVSAVSTADSLLNGISVGFVTTAAVPALFPMFSPTEFYTAPLIYNEVRCTAAAALFSNVSPVMSKEGTVEAARLIAKKGGLLSVTGSAVSTTHPKDRYFGLLENGLYSFTLPDAESENFCHGAWTIDATDSSKVLNLPVFDLDNIGYKNTIIFSDLESSSSTTLAVTLSYHIEFRSSSMLFPVGFSTVPLEQYHGVQMALAQLGPFQENPIHWSAIATAVRAAVSKIYPIVAPHARTMAVQAGNMLLSAAANKLSKTFGQQKQMAAPTKKLKAQRVKVAKWVEVPRKNKKKKGRK